jgi:flagellar biosynthesis/type III secretory pathway chaperone
MSSRTLPPTTAQLCRLLSQEEAACRRLLDTVHEERAAIRTLAITEFHAINCRRLSILESLQALADERQRVVHELAGRQGLPSAMSIHGLLDHVKGAGSAELQAVYRSYMAAAKTVRDEIKQNVVLIEGIRGVVDQALSAGTAVVPGQDLYTADGQSSGAGRVNMLIHQRG